MSVDKISRYWKTVVAVLGAVVIVGTEVVQALDNGAADGTLDQSDVIKIVVAFATALGVYAKKNVAPVGAAYDPNISEAEKDDNGL